jgi:hypothetical protein
MGRSDPKECYCCRLFTGKEKKLLQRRWPHLSDTLAMPDGNLSTTRGYSASLLALLATSSGSFLWFRST